MPQQQRQQLNLSLRDTFGRNRLQVSSDGQQAQLDIDDEHYQTDDPESLLADVAVSHRERPLLVGPDLESRQWVEAAARRHGLDFIVCEKLRHDDHRVDIALPAGADLRGRAVVILDDVASSGHTLARTAERVLAAGLVTQVVEADGLDAAIAGYVDQLRHGGPEAVARTKELLRRVPAMTRDESFVWTAEVSAGLFTSTEAREGMTAFLEKRKPEWAP